MGEVDEREEDRDLGEAVEVRANGADEGRDVPGDGPAPLRAPCCVVDDIDDEVGEPGSGWCLVSKCGKGGRGRILSVREVKKKKKTYPDQRPMAALVKFTHRRV